MIYFYIRNKSKKYGNTPTMEMAYLIKIYDVNIQLIGINYVEKHIALVNSFIMAIDLLVYFYMESLLLKLLIMFFVTLILVFIFYSFLGRFYRKLLVR
jgi:polyferredoxin